MSFIVYAILLLIIGASVTFYLDKKRISGLRKFARKHGLAFEQKPRKIGAGDFDLWKKGYRNTFSNLVKIQKDNISWKFFDFTSDTRSGGSSGGRAYTQTIARAKIPKAKFPKFCLKTEHFFHKLGQLMGMKDIDFDMYPQFSKEYVLGGQDENAVRSLFTPSRIQFFENNKLKGILEGNANVLIYYRLHKKISDEEAISFSSQAERIIKVFVSNSAKSGHAVNSAFNS
jgi:hypothetical protein